MASQTRSFTYQRRTVEDIKTRANSRGSDFDSIYKPQYKIYKVREGKNLVRVMPPTWEKAGHYGFDIHVNYGIGADNNSYLSLSKMKQGEKDPIAEARELASREDNEGLMKALRPRHRILTWVIDRQAEEEGPQLWAAPFTLDKDIANLCYDPDTKDIIYLDDPEEGYDLRFYKEGQGMLTKYPSSKMKLLGPSPIHEDEAKQNEWMDYIVENPVPGCLQFYDYDHIKAAFKGQARINEDDAEDRNVRRRQNGTAKAQDDEGEPDAPSAPAHRVTPPETPSRRPPPRVTQPDPPDSDEPKRESIRERIARRHQAAKSPEPDEDE